MRVIRDTYELPDDDGDFSRGQPGKGLNIGVWLPLLLIILLTLAILIGGSNYVTAHERDDSFCTGCHTVPETTYFERGQAAVGGSVAIDLSSFHYQQIRGKGGNIHCVDCHLGDQSLDAQTSKWPMTARHALVWLAGRNITNTESLKLATPHLTNDSCIACHRDTVLTVGQANHHHNALPVAYNLWKAGARLVLPADTRDAQVLTAHGLTRYETTVQCSTCHLTHRSIAAEHYASPKTMADGCERCHSQARK